MTETKKASGAAEHEAVQGDDLESKEASARVLRQFRIVFNAIKTHFREVEKQAGVGGAQLWALSVIQGAPGIGVSDLAKAMDVHQSTASNLVRTLSELKLITAQRAGTDRRSVQLSVSPAGVKVLSRAPGPFTGVLPEALATLDRKTLTRLSEDLSKLIAALNLDEQQDGRVPLGQLGA